MIPKISVMCVTRGEQHALQFLLQMSNLARVLNGDLIVGADGPMAHEVVADWAVADRLVLVQSNGLQEHVQDEVLAHCTGDWVLKLDDDEAASPAMVRWLWAAEYLDHDNWCFPRMHLWPDNRSMLMDPQLFPDHQTRLAIKAKSGGRCWIHATSPFGYGEIAPVAIEHHKFLVKTREQREEIVRRYDSFGVGNGTGSMLAFSLPEDVHTEVRVVEKGEGDVPWTPKFERTMRMGEVTWPCL